MLEISSSIPQTPFQTTKIPTDQKKKKPPLNAFTSRYVILFADVQNCVSRAPTASTSPLMVAAYVVAGSCSSNVPLN